MLLVVSDYILVIYRQPELLTPISLNTCMWYFSNRGSVTSVKSFCTGLDSCRSLLSNCMHKHLILGLFIGLLLICE